LSVVHPGRPSRLPADCPEENEGLAGRPLQVLKLAAGDPEKIGREAFYGFALEGCAGEIVLETLDHRQNCIAL
jgi:hypothetical protein